MACSDCPQFIIAPIASSVQQTLNRVREIKWITNSYTGVLQQVLSNINAVVDTELRTLVNLIPTPPDLSIDAIIAMLLCPLTPLAVSIDPAIVSFMDYQQMLVRVRRILKADSKLVVQGYEAAINNLGSAALIKIMRSYLKELYRAVDDASDFIAAYPINVGMSLIVKEVCPDIYADAAWPFQALVEEVSDWSFDGILPTGLPLDAQVAMTLVAQAEAKLLTWTTLAASIAI